MENLAKAIIAVMKDVKGIDKSMTVGTGNSAYKGVADKDVKEIIGGAMEKHGLTLLPLDYETKFQIDRWEETNQYGTKMKQNVFTEVKGKYLLLHTSGESQIVSGLGHGVDPQDKSAGKATTYSLKNLMLYLFLVPTGKIDDADNTHSDDIETPQNATKPKPELPWLNEKDAVYAQVVEAVKTGKRTIADLRKTYAISKAMEATLTAFIPK